MKSEYVIDVSDATFQTEVINRSRQTPVVVDFWAPWCGPCRMLGPVLEKLANEYAGGFILAKINTDENQRVAGQFGIQGIPAVKAFKDGKMVAEFVGAQPEPRVREFLARFAVKGGGQAAAGGGPDAETLLAQGKYAEAEEALRKAGAGNGSLPALNLTLAKALLGQGKAQEAGQLLDKLGDSPEAGAAEALKPLVGLLLTAASPANGSGEIEGLYQKAGQAIIQGQMRSALDALLDVLRRDKRYRNGEPRQVMLALFALLGDESPLVREYRTKLAMVLF
ncbi:MAG: Thioredoxin [Chloroflexi bacterium ADurb.Bin325]|nr:MAG: Thioredoxin [Chloroflexi bacterium ADurb.Bin325]